MRQIEVDTDVYAKIWALRAPPEETENEILARILGNKTLTIPVGVRDRSPPAGEAHQSRDRHAKWWQVIATALENLGGKASLARIYAEVRRLASGAGRRMPTELESVVRGTLEDNCADSERWKRVRDVFWMPEGRGAGVWALRK